MPRVVTAADWDTICRGAGQRTRALDHFIRDVYGSQAIVADGIVPEELLDRAPGYRSSGLLGGRGIRAHINGLDLVSDAPGRWCVLEDNLRIPSGIAYAMWNRDISRHFLPELPAPAGLLGVEEVDGLPCTFKELLGMRQALVFCIERVPFAWLGGKPVELGHLPLQSLAFFLAACQT